MNWVVEVVAEQRSWESKEVGGRRAVLRDSGSVGVVGGRACLPYLECRVRPSLAHRLSVLGSLAGHFHLLS